MCTHRKYNTNTFLISKKYHRIICKFIEETRNITEPTSRSQNPDHKPHNPGHSGNAFTWIPHDQRTSHMLYRFLPGITGELHQFQEHYIHGPKQYIATALWIDMHAANKQNILHQTFLWAMCYSFPRLIFSLNQLLQLKCLPFWNFHRSSLYFSTHTPILTDHLKRFLFLIYLSVPICLRTPEGPRFNPA